MPGDEEWGGPADIESAGVESYPDAGSGAATDPGVYSGMFTDASGDSDWHSSSGATVGVVYKDPTVLHERGADYSKLDAGGADWQRRYFERCRFTDAMMVGLTTTSCSFVECDFSDVDLTHSRHRLSAFLACQFRGATLTSAFFEDCKLAGSAFDSAQLGGIVFHGGDLTSVSLVGADLSGVDLSEVRLYGADLSGVVLRNATLVGADLRDVTLDGTDFEDADLSGALIQGFDPRAANLVGTRVDRDQAVELARAFGVIVG